MSNLAAYKNVYTNQRLAFSDEEVSFAKQGNESEQMKQLRLMYHNTQQEDLEENAAYLFVIGGFDQAPTIQGDMPRGKAVGYIFDNGTNFNDGRLVAHELGHGLFALEHTFATGYRVPQGSTNNLMDYVNNDFLASWQWKIINNPGFVWNFLEGDEDAMAVNKDGFKVQEMLRIIRLLETRRISSYSPITACQAKNIQIGNNNYSFVNVKLISKTNKREVKDKEITIDNVLITTGSSTEAQKLYDFISGMEQNIYGTYTGNVTLNNEIITFDMLVKQNENIFINLLNSGNYKDLTMNEKIALLVPIQEWKLGYRYAASIFYYWFKGDKNNDTKTIKLTKKNFEELFEKSEFFKQNLKDAIIDLESDNIYNVSSTSICLDNIKDAIIEGRETKVDLPENYTAADKQSKDYMGFFKTYPVSLVWNGGIKIGKGIINDDFAFSIGSFTFMMNIEGYLKIIAQANYGHLEGENFYYRIWDSFDFSGSQPLGSWNGDVFNVSFPTLLSDYSIGNSEFRNLYEKISGNKSNNGSTPWDFDIITEYQSFQTKVSGINYSIDFFDKITPSIYYK